MVFSIAGQEEEMEVGNVEVRWGGDGPGAEEFLRADDIR
jgi:hypothetical protein